ncbi:MAG: thiamine pyrophosphate-dependent enzyme, partial [Acidimicrobiales bacterium]
DIEPLNTAWTFPVDHSLIGDAGRLVERLTDALGTPTTRTDSSGAKARARERRLANEVRLDAATEPEPPFAPQTIIRLLQEGFPEDGVIACDAGENRLFMMQWYKSKAGGEYLQPAAGGGMGYAVPAAMAAKLAFLDRSALAVCGDGGFAMSIHALMTAVQEDLPIAVVVFNNGALGWVLHGMGDEAVAANFAAFDYAGIARSLGCDGVRISSSDELIDEIAKIKSIERPLVIDVPTSLATSFKDVSYNLVRGERAKTGY